MGSEEASEATSEEINMAGILKEVPEEISMVIMVIIITRNLMATATTAASTGIRKENAIAKREIIMVGMVETEEIEDIEKEEIEDILIGNVGRPIIYKLMIFNYYILKPHAQIIQK